MDRRILMTGLALAGTGFATAAGAQTKVDAKDDVTSRLIAQFAASLSAHDMDAFAALFADDYINHQVSAAAPTPPPGSSAKQNSVGFFAGRLKAMPDLSVAVEASVAAGDLAAASFVYSGTHKGDYFGVAPTGRALRFTSCDIFRLRDGKIAEHWGMGDIAGVLAQLKG